jgi:probable HAF family extracellular repeat protein
MRLLAALALVAGALALVPAEAGAVPMATFTKLYGAPTWPDVATRETIARDVAGDGSRVVGNGASPSGTEAVMWDSGGTFLPGPSDLPGGVHWGVGEASSADGSVVAGVSHSGGGEEAFRWTSGGGMVGLGDLPGGVFQSRATGVSGDGSVVVGFSNSGLGTEPFRWTAGGGMLGLGLAGFATDVSADGSIIVGRSFGTGEAFRYSGFGFNMLGDLPGGPFASVALGVSADGSTIVGQGTSASGNEAFRWTSGSGMVGLGDLFGGVFASGAVDASADGSAVVGWGYTAAGQTAFLWTGATGMRSLEDVLVNDYGLSLGGMTLAQATAISDDGTTIVGFGLDGGVYRGFIATLPTPEPGALGLLAIGGAGLAAAGRRRRA